MKKKNRKISTLMLFASTGAIICTGSDAVANDPDSRKAGELQGSRIYQTEETVEVRTDSQLGPQGAGFESQIMDEPAGAERRSYSRHQTSTMHAPSFGTVHKASDIIGMDVRNQHNEKLGDVKDVMVDLHSGRVPFAVISTEGMGDRLIAVPPSALTARAAGNQLVLNMDRERLRSAPSFERNRWPNMANQQWSSDVYRFYGEQPYWQSGSYQSVQPYERRTEFHSESSLNEPAGATYYREEAYLDRDTDHDGFEDSNTMDDINKGSNTRGGAEDLQRFDEKANARIGRTVPSTHWQTADRGIHHKSVTRETRHMQHGSAMTTGVSSMGQLHRASELIGMNIKNAQNETVGEIKDVVLDLNSGHVAYAVVSADRFLDTRNQLVAIPPSLFTYGTDSRTVTLNAERGILVNAPRFQRDNWNQVSNEQYVSRVYSHYGQQPYWQAQGFRQGTQYREPAGAEFEPQYQQNYQRQEFQQQQQFEQDRFQQQDDSSFQPQQDISEPSGAQNDQSLRHQDAAPSVQAPSAAQPQSGIAPDVDSQESLQRDQSQQQDLNAPDSLEQQEPERAISEPSGAEPQSSIEIEQQSSSTEVKSSEPDAAAPSAGFETEAESSAQVGEPSGAQTESQYEQTPEAAQQEAASTQSEEQSSVTSETESQTQQVDEAAGAAVGTAGATSSQDQTQQLERVRSALKGDSSLNAQNVQVSSENGKIVLRGTVSSETEKQQIEEKLKGMILDNQIRVESSTDSGVQSQP